MQQALQQGYSMEQAAMMSAYYGAGATSMPAGYENQFGQTYNSFLAQGYSPAEATSMTEQSMYAAGISSTHLESPTLYVNSAGGIADYTGAGGAGVSDNLMVTSSGILTGTSSYGMNAIGMLSNAHSYGGLNMTQQGGNQKGGNKGKKPMATKGIDRATPDLSNGNGSATKRNNGQSDAKLNPKQAAKGAAANVENNKLLQANVKNIVYTTPSKQGVESPPNLERQTSGKN